MSGAVKRNWAPSLATICVGLIGISLLVLLIISSSKHERHAPGSKLTGVVTQSSVAANGLTLTSASMDLPPDEATYPEGPGVDLVNQRCLACHSAQMALVQPKLKPEQWKAIVEKMRDVYHAPIEEGEVAPIAEYFARRQGK